VACASRDYTHDLSEDALVAAIRARSVLSGAPPAPTPTAFDEATARRVARQQLTALAALPPAAAAGMPEGMLLELLAAQGHLTYDSEERRAAAEACAAAAAAAHVRARKCAASVASAAHKGVVACNALLEATKQQGVSEEGLQGLREVRDALAGHADATEVALQEDEAVTAGNKP
jgi:hypothetical protein